MGTTMLNRLSVIWRHRFWRREDAATAVEYAVMLSLIIIIAIGAIGLLGQSTMGLFNTSNENLTAVGFGS